MHISLLHSIVDLKKYKEYLLIQLSQENIESNFLYANMETWIHESLSSLLDFPVPDDMIKYVLSIENNKELEEYMKTLLNFDDPKHKGFFLEFVNKRFSRGRPQGQNSQKKKISKNKENKPAEYITKADVPPTMEQGQTETNKSKKKAKFVNLYSQDGQNAQVVFLKGRHHCDCQASKHPLINNCTNCGRIVCKQEGSGPCLFCGNLVCTPEEQKEVNSKSKAGAKLMETLMEKKRPKGWEAALAHRNRLLEYDRTSERRTHVTDDDSDYFKSNSVWLSAAEREKLEQYQRSVQEKRHASRLSKKMTFDFGGRRIVEDEDAGFEVDENKINEITNSDRGAGGGERRDLWSGAAGDRDVAPGVNAPLLAFDPSVVVEARARHPGSGGGGVGGARVQDGGIQEMVDAGKCLSMHQPWASLLVEGIKMHEGRTWYSSHRGRLWIASTVKPPEQDTVHSLEAMYRAIHQDEGLVFPSFYPTGCLLGCVNVDDCLPQEEYQKIYPGGESDSPYVFICSNPTSLRLRFPVKGQHKIYNLDKTIHQAAVKFMLKSAKQSADA